MRTKEVDSGFKADALTLRILERTPSTRTSTITSEDDVLSVLETQPSVEDLFKCLKWLVNNQGHPGKFNIKIPSPKAASIVNILVSAIAVNFWGVIDQDVTQRPLREAFLQCLRSIHGIGALILRIRSLINQQMVEPEGSLPLENDYISSLLYARSILGQILKGDDVVKEISNSLFAQDIDKKQQHLLWSQATALFAGGRILSTLAEVDLLLQKRGCDLIDASLGKGDIYAVWLGRNIRRVHTGSKGNSKVIATATAALFGRALSLGFTYELVETVFESSIYGIHAGIESDLQFLKSLKSREQQQVLYKIIDLASGSQYRNLRVDFIPGFAALLNTWCEDQSDLSGALSGWITGLDRGRTNADIAVHRSVIAVLAGSLDSLVKICKSLIASFGDKLFIQNAPIVQQEVQVKDLLLTIGHIFRKDPEVVRQLSKSSIYLNAISNRIAASAFRPRFLGMAVAIALSDLTDAAGSRVKFKELIEDKEDLKRYTLLLEIDDKIGTINNLQPLEGVNDVSPSRRKQTNGSSEAMKTDKRQLAPTARDNLNSRSTKSLVQSFSSGSESETEDDPTLVQRKKPNPPVYIRDLLAGLRDTENYDRYNVCLSSAASLIRRKANFGTEVTEHIEDLASELAGAKDAIDSRNFAEFQLQGMIAVIIAQPARMGRWFSISAFIGDYSMSQRISILSAIALASRELAGYGQEDASAIQARTPARPSFPSKELPPSLKAFAETGSPNPDPVQAIATELQRSLIRPMAASAADQLTGPEMLKIRTLSSRLKIEKKGKRTIRNDLAKIVADNFFAPLTDRFRLELETKGASSSFASPILLAHYLKTLALLLTASGPNTVSLSQLTSDLLTMCLASRLRGVALSHLPVLESLLFCFLTVLDVNSSTERNLVVDHGNEILEIKTWVENVLERTTSGDAETDRVRGLAAGVLLRCAEVIERHQQEIMGKMAQFI